MRGNRDEYDCQTGNHGHYRYVCREKQKKNVYGRWLPHGRKLERCERTWDLIRSQSKTIHTPSSTYALVRPRVGKVVEVWNACALEHWEACYSLKNNYSLRTSQTSIRLRTWKKTIKLPFWTHVWVTLGYFGPLTRLHLRINQRLSILME